MEPGDEQPLNFAVIKTSSRKTKKRGLVLLDLPKVDITEHQKLLVNARVIEDINAVSYPEGVVAPIPALNQNARKGKFRYDRDFLLQFMGICRDKPASLPPLHMLGLEPSKSLISSGGSSRHRPGLSIPEVGISSPATLNNGSMNSSNHFTGNRSSTGYPSTNLGTGGLSPTISNTLTHTDTRSGFWFPTDSATDSVPLQQYASIRRDEKKKRRGSWRRRHSPDSHEMHMVDYQAAQSFQTSPIIPASSRLSPVAPTFVPKRKVMLGNQDGDRVKPSH